MNENRFFTTIGENAEFLGGIVSIDIVGHSKLRGGERTKSDTKSELLKFIEYQLLDSNAILLKWEGDGGAFLFNVKSGCDEMILFADRVRHLTALFNRSKGYYNFLPVEQEIAVRIVCHAGSVINKNNSTGALSGDTLNHLFKAEKLVSLTGYIVISHGVYERLSKALTDRLSDHVHNDLLGQTYALDRDISLANIQYTDELSMSLKQFVSSVVAQHDCEELLYFAYTNELLYQYLAYELGNVRVKIVARNWTVERIEETEYNNEIIETAKGEDSNPRLWKKSGLIKVRAEETNQAKHLGRPIDQRFYDQSPLFNGAILINKDGVRKAYMGISGWEIGSASGGSPYKLESWPAIILDGRDHNHAHLINYLESRFHEIWKKGKKYEDVVMQEQSEELHNPNLVKRFWEINQSPYLIVAPGRYFPKRIMPAMAGEDLEASRLVADFLRRYGCAITNYTVPLSDGAGAPYPKESEEFIENWEGHVVYICTSSISADRWKTFEEMGLRYHLKETGDSTRMILDQNEEGIRLSSPADKSSQDERDYALIAKMNRPERNTKFFLITGIHAMGTWGAALHLVDINKLQELMLGIEGNIAAVLEIEYSSAKKRVISSRVKLAPEKL